MIPRIRSGFATSSGEVDEHSMRTAIAVEGTATERLYLIFLKNNLLAIGVGLHSQLLVT